MRKDAFLPFIKETNPDVLCLQETKAQQGQAEIDLPEYEEVWNSAERKGYSGTAIFSKVKPISVTYDLPGVKPGTLKDSFGDAITEGPCDYDGVQRFLSCHGVHTKREAGIRTACVPSQEMGPTIP